MPDGPARRLLAEVIADHAGRLLGLPGVVGVGETRCDDAPCVLVLVAAHAPDLEAALPATLEGYAVRVEVSGEFRALDIES